jgi:hypothetical protein
MKSHDESEFQIIFDKRDELLTSEDSKELALLKADEQFDAIRELAETVQSLTTETSFIYTRS